MKDETIEAMVLGMAGHGSIWQTVEDSARAAINALESTDDMKALRADAESHRMRMKNCDCQQEGLCHYCRTGEERGA